MLREGTWLVRHACSNTQFGAQNATALLTARASTRLSRRRPKISTLGCPSCFSSFAEQEETAFEIIDDIHNNFGASLSTSSPSHTTWPYHKFNDRYPSRRERQPSTQLKANDSTETINPGLAISKCETVHPVRAVPVEKHVNSLSSSISRGSRPSECEDEQNKKSQSNGLSADSDVRELPQTEFQKLIGLAAQDRQHHRVIQLFQTYSESNRLSNSLHSPKPNTSVITTPILNCFLTALLRLGRMREFAQALAFFDPLANRQPDRRTYTILLRAYIQSLNLRKARQLLMDMFDRGIKIDSRILRTVIGGEGELAVSLESVDCLLGLFCSKHFDLRDMRCYNLIINAYLRRDRPEKARAVLDEITSKGLQPDGGTFSALMQYQARKEGSAGVKAILSSMAKSGVPPELNHLNILIATLARESRIDLRSANSVVASHGRISDIATCNIVLRALLRHKFDSEVLQQHFLEMRSLGIQPDAYTFTMLLNEYKKKKGSWERAQQVLLRQVTSNPQNVNHITKNVLIHHLISKFSEPSKNTPLNTNLNPAFVDEGQLQLQWDLRTITSLIVSYSRCREWSRIVDLYQKVRRRSVRLDRHFYRILVEALLRGRKYKLCLEAVSSLHKSDSILDQLFSRECKIRISHAMYKHIGRGKKALMRDIDDFLKYADEKGIMISGKHCNLIAIAFLDIRKAHLSIELLESRYHRRGRFQELDNDETLAMSSWTILMRAYARRGSGGISGIRSCISRSTSIESTRPSRAFLNFLHHLGKNENLRSAKPEDCDFFLQTHLKFCDRKKRSSNFPHNKGRAALTKSNIVTWMNGGKETQSLV